MEANQTTARKKTKERVAAENRTRNATEHIEKTAEIIAIEKRELLDLLAEIIAVAFLKDNDPDLLETDHVRTNRMRNLRT